MAESSSLPVCQYVFHIICLYMIFLMVSFDKCFFFTVSRFFQGDKFIDDAVRQTATGTKDTFLQFVSHGGHLKQHAEGRVFNLE